MNLLSGKDANVQFRGNYLPTHAHISVTHVLFIIYMIPLALLLKHNGMAYHLDTYESQLIQEFSLSDNTSPEIAIRKMNTVSPVSVSG